MQIICIQAEHRDIHHLVHTIHVWSGYRYGPGHSHTCTFIFFTSAYLQVSGGSSDQTKSLQMLSSAKLMLRGVLTKIKVW